MALPNAFAQYNNNKVMTASPAELTLMLYDGAIKFCNIAIDAVENKNAPKAHANIVKVENIVAYLRNTLNMDYPVAKEYDKMYDYIQRRLVEANLKKNVEMLKEVNGHLHTIRDTWKEVMRINRAKGNL
ncbi:flagellar export chaperone FliS [Parablautia muri]|uniref:Flagellar secretion chaperone FliS n=1 Tax=Parablautia muri TaxID=2320879 RepID=A0A9X5BEY4_9FIRM|nr:flagellar export chaperone FliS [Parablautia muri]NBJ92556.1 flagellar export chaperone FliS [Parablautia muri]